MRILLMLGAAMGPLFAGQSWVTGNATGAQIASNSSVPPVNIPFCKSIAWDVVPQAIGSFYFFQGNPFTGTALPLYFEAIAAGGGVQLAVGFTGETGVSGLGQALASFQINGTPGNALFGWACHDMAAFGGTNTDYVGLYDINGKVVAQASQTYTSVATISTSGWQISGGNGSEAWHVAFERICTGEAAIPLWKTIPKTFGGCPLGNELLEWKFDGTLADSSGHGYTASISGAGGTTPTYAPTLFQGPVAILKTANPPVWTYIAPMRAGEPNQLDCTSSYTQSDTSNAVSCFWQVLSGPSTPTFDNRRALQPTLTGLVFGDYLVQLTVTDVAGLSATATADIGAVGTDSNRVVVQASPDADVIFGPMIELGQNPWGLQDSLDQQMIDLQYVYQGCCAIPTWAALRGQGTVSYTFCGKGGCSAGGGTSLTSAINSTTLSIPVNNASVLDLSTLPSVPTTIIVDSEVFLICGTTGNSGPQTLTVCYDGRGVQGGGAFVSGASAHNNGSIVIQFKITGTSTLFESDPNTQMCPTPPAGYIVSPVGTVVYATGTVTMTPGSATVAGNGTSWTNANGIFASNGQTMVVWATHGGTKFTFMAQVTSLPGATGIGLAVPYPSDADNGPFSYAILNYLNPVLTYTRILDGSLGRTIQNGLQVCIGNLQMGGLPAHDYGTPTDISVMSGQSYSFTAGIFGSASQFQQGFYGTGLAVRSYYLRSGYAKALQLANFLDEYWITSPEVDGGYAGLYWLYQGGGLIGAYADMKTNPNTQLIPADMRGYSTATTTLPALGCDADDTRDTGYERAAAALAAKYDTSPPAPYSWIANLEAIYNGHDVGGLACKQANNSFANGFLVDANGATPNVPNSGWAPLHLTNGSAEATDATGLGITADRCWIAASGTLFVTNGSGVATDSGNNLIDPNVANFGRRLIIHGTKGGGTIPYLGVFSYLYHSSNSITLNGQWPGDNGSFTYVIENTGYPSSIGASQADHANLSTSWACTWNNASHLTLDRPWTGTSGVYNLYQSPGRPDGGYGIGGYGQQPFMLGIAITGINYASQVGDGTYDAKWKTLGQNAATFLWNNAYDPYTQGIQYGVIYGGCDQKVPVSTTVGFILGTAEGSGDWCQNDLLPHGGIDVARGVAVEALGSLTQYYQSNPTLAVKAFGDTVYGSIWASTTLTTGGVYTALDNLQASNCYPPNLASFKWPGFCFGMGMSHQWPAVRLGGVLPAMNRTLFIGICLGSGCSGRVPNATNVDVILTAPNGVVSTTNCTSSPCSVTADARQGNYLMVMKYKNVSAKVLATTSPQILTVQ
jgi:hypothetical protein